MNVLKHLKKTLQNEMGIIPLLLGAAAGGAAGWFGSQKKVNTDPYGNLNPEQKALTQRLGPYFNSVINTPAETYPGQLTAPISQGEQSVVDSSNRLAAMSEGGYASLINPDPNVYNNLFDTEVANPTIANWRQNTQPIIEEALPSFSIARGKTVGSALDTVNNNLLQQRYTGWNAAQDRRLQALGQAPVSMGQWGANAAVPRVIEQSGLTAKYQDWAAGNTNKLSSIDQMLKFLGLSTGTTTISNPYAGVAGALTGAMSGASWGASMADAGGAGDTTSAGTGAGITYTGPGGMGQTFKL